jgi:hypothetical protein
MKQFKTLVVLKHPRELVWTTMRDKLPELAPLLGDIENVITEQRDEQSGGRVLLVNLWSAKPVIPSALQGIVNSSMLRWTDHADYDVQKWECRWRIEPHFARERTQCTGVTRYEPALGGAGTRVTFEGSLEVNAHGLPGVPAFLESTVGAAIESFIATLIPGNFRKLTIALGTHLEPPKQQSAAG